MAEWKFLPRNLGLVKQDGGGGWGDSGPGF